MDGAERTKICWITGDQITGYLRPHIGSNEIVRDTVDGVRVMESQHIIALTPGVYVNKSDRSIELASAVTDDPCYIQAVGRALELALKIIQKLNEEDQNG